MVDQMSSLDKFECEFHKYFRKLKCQGRKSNMRQDLGKPEGRRETMHPKVSCYTRYYFFTS